MYWVEVQIPMERGNFDGEEGAAHCKVGTLYAVCGELCKNG